VYAVQALNQPHATNFYKQVAEITDGIHIGLDEFRAVTDMVLAVCYREAQPEHLEVFEKGAVPPNRLACLLAQHLRFSLQRSLLRDE